MGEQTMLHANRHIRSIIVDSVGQFGILDQHFVANSAWALGFDCRVDLSQRDAL
jgi:hypothetical protein